MIAIYTFAGLNKFMSKNNVRKFCSADSLHCLLMLCFAVVVLAGCVKIDPLSERARLKPLMLAAQAGDDAAFRKLEAEVKRGVPEAMNQMGIYYHKKYTTLAESEQSKPGSDFIYDDKHPFYKKALALWEQAALRGNAPAAYNLGLQREFPNPYVTHEKTEVSDVAAVRWYRLAAELGDPAAMVKLWNIWYRDTANAEVAKRSGPRAVAPDEGTKWLISAAKHGEPEAMTWLAGIVSEWEMNGQKFNAEDGFFWKQVLITYYSERNQWSQPDDAKYNLSPEQVAVVKGRVRKWKPEPVIWPRVVKKAK